MAKSEKSVKAYETSDILLSGRVCAAGRTGRSGAAAGRDDRHHGLFPVARRAPRGGAGQSDLRGRHARCAGRRRLREGPSGRSAAREGIPRDGHLLARARVPRRCRRRGACGRFGGPADGHSDPVALRRRVGPSFRRDDAHVRRPGGRYAGRGAAVLYLPYHHAADDGRLCRRRAQGDRAGPSESQRRAGGRSRARHEVPFGRRGAAGPRRAI